VKKEGNVSRCEKWPSLQ